MRLLAIHSEGYRFHLEKGYAARVKYRVTLGIVFDRLMTG
jgi:hypothetical protein